MRRRSLTLGLGLTGLLAGLPSCGQATEPLGLAYHAWSGYAPLHLLRQLRLMPPEALRAVDTHSASESMALLQTGKVQAAALTLDPAGNIYFGLLVAARALEARAAYQYQARSAQA